jgi:hypothetical protein
MKLKSPRRNWLLFGGEAIIVAIAGQLFVLYYLAKSSAWFQTTQAVVDTRAPWGTNRQIYLQRLPLPCPLT